MNKKLIIAIAAVLLLLIGGFLIFKMQKGGSSIVSTSDQTEGGAKSLKDLISAGIAQKCTYSTSDESGSSEGVSYISGGKVRGDFTTVIEGKTTVSHMISDGKTNYIWSDGEKTGIKMTVSDTSASSSPVTQENGQVKGGDLDQKYDYKCATWVTDQSVFTPPTTVTFTDFSSMFGATPSSGNSNSTQCGMCNSLTGDDKTQCLAALKCN